MVPAPPELEERYRRFLEGRGDEIDPLLRFLRDDRRARADTKSWAALILSRIYILRGAIDLASSFLRIAASCSGGAPRTLRLGILINYAIVCKARGRADRAVGILRAVVDAALRSGESLAAAKAAANIAVCLARGGDAEDACSYAALAERIYRSIGDRKGLVRLELARGIIDAGRGRCADATDRIAAVLRECSEGEFARERLAALLLMCEFCLHERDSERAAQWLEQAAAMTHALERFAPQRARLLHLRHILYRVTGDDRRAEIMAERSIRLRRILGLGRDVVAVPPSAGAVEPPFMREALPEGTPYRYRCSDESRVGAESPNAAPMPDAEQDRFITHNPTMALLLARVRRAASVEAPILLCGETGVGKDLIARLIHRWSRRAHEPFIPVNLASIPAELFESVLFGHARGAFTGAVSASPGLVAAAARGTLFLDEIGELPPSLQPKLLRFIDRGEYYMLGETTPRRTGARIVCATNRDLASSCDAGAFRRDLYYRIAALRFLIPPLRVRRDDIQLIADHVLERICRQHGFGALRFHPLAVEALTAFDWPGNVRELESLVLETALRARGGIIRIGDLPAAMIVAARHSEITGDLRSYERSLLRDRIVAVLGDCCGNRTRAASILGLKRTTLIGMMKRLGIA